MPAVIQRYLTRAQWAAENPVLAAGEMGVEFGLNGRPDRFKLGDGLHAWDKLKYFINETEINIDTGRLSEESLDLRYSKKIGENTLGSMGDSMTEANHNIGGGYVADRRSWADLAVLLMGSRVRYIGDAAAGGADIQTIRESHLPIILNAKPTFCTVLAGQNSLTGFNQQDVTDLIFIYESLMNAGITPIVIGNPPTNVGPEQFRLNHFLSAYAQAKGLPYFDMGAELINPETGLYKPGMSEDDIHPNTPLAIGIIAKSFAKFMVKILPSRAQVPTYLLPQSKKDGESLNPLFDPQTNDPNVPLGWTLPQNTITTLTKTAYGNKFRLTKLNANRGQANANTTQLIPGSEYYIVCRIDAEVEKFSGSWSLLLLDAANNYSILVGFSNMTTDVADDTVLALRFRVPTQVADPQNIGLIVPALLLYSTDAFNAEVGAAGATMSISQFQFRLIEEF